MRAKIAKVVFFAGLAAILVHIIGQLPREMTVDVLYGSARRDLQAATLTYRNDGTVVRRATFRYETDAPETQRHVARLPRGRYELEITLDYAATTRSVVVMFDAADETVRVDVGP